MATAAATISPECPICMDNFDTPKILGCGHTFCLKCVKKLIGDKTETFCCPTCQQNVKIPEGGAEAFTTNFHLSSTQPPSTTQPKCPNHNQREVDYYCNNCNIGLCLKCILGQHKEHETLDIERDETRNKAIEKLERSQNIIKNRIKNLEKTRSTLLESFEELKSLCEDSCTKVTEQTEQIVSDLRKGCEQIIKDIRNNLEENRKKVEDREMEITCEINLLEGNMESNISPSTKTTLNILQTLPRLLEIEKQDEKDYNLCVQYLQWVGKDFSLDIDQVGSVISKTFYVTGSYQFIFDLNDITTMACYNKDKFKNNNLVWSCGVERPDDGPLHIDIALLPDDNPELDYCTIDGTISLLNFNNGSKTVTRSVQDLRLKAGELWSWWDPVTWLKFNNKKKRYLNSKCQFVIQLNITNIKEISWK